MNIFKDEITQYIEEKAKIYLINKNPNEGQLRPSFSSLLRKCVETKNYTLIEEEKMQLWDLSRFIRPDGLIKNKTAITIGCWESKGPKVDLDQEIGKKIEKGYPVENILYENSQMAILIQGGVEILRVSMEDIKAFGELLNGFLSYDKESKQFQRELDKFKEIVPQLAEEIKKLFDEMTLGNEAFQKQLDKLKEICQQSIREDISDGDIKEMITQHILTEDIFNTVFQEIDFHRDNNIAKEMDQTIRSFLSVDKKREILRDIRGYYNRLISLSHRVRSTTKQDLLNNLYEDFFKAYNPKKADTDGVVYTPSEVVNFMVKSSDEILKKHFHRQIKDKNVEILDPCTGTGTFVTALLEHIDKTGNKEELKYKYENELHANEVSILPYYIANLNIEAKYRDLSGDYLNYLQLCFVDTLDNAISQNFRSESRMSLLNQPVMNEENTKRIKEQNEKKISLIIGNPPYNSNQQNENDNNKNREYPEIDDRIKKTFVKESTAQKTKTYDMYSRFYRWAMDRIDGDGVIAFITNRSFIDARGYDGFRKIVKESFNYIYVLDLMSDVRKNPKIAGSTHNVFGIQTGVAMMFLVKEKNNLKPCEIRYYAMDDFMRSEEKKYWLYRTEHLLVESNWKGNFWLESIEPDRRNYWLHQTDNDWDDLLPVVSKQTKGAKHTSEYDAIFKLYSLGIVTARDDWVYDYSEDTLRRKVKFFVEKYREAFKIPVDGSDWITIQNKLTDEIKWTRQLKKDLLNKKEYQYKQKALRKSLYRPFVRKHFYYKKELNEMQCQQPRIFPMENPELSNVVISFSGTSSSKPFSTLSINYIPSLDFIEKTQCIPLYVYEDGKTKKSNLTEFGLQTFNRRYPKEKITAERIFSYVYAVFHCSHYREKYAVNLKRDLPRIPLYKDFSAYSELGQRLLELHIEFESLEEYGEASVVHHGKKLNPKVKLSFSKRHPNTLDIDENTQIQNIPQAALSYKIGNRSPIEWVCDQYKEKKIKDLTIAKQFNTYRFADYKEEVISLVLKLMTLSVETTEIVEQISALKK